MAHNNIGITGTGYAALTAGGFDTAGDSYSAALLAALTPAVTAGSTVTVNGVAFTWPGPDITTNYDNWKTAAAQTITFAPVSNATAVAFLGAASDGSSSGTATINYTTGVPQTFTLGFTDWKTGTPAFSNTLALTLSNYDTSAGVVKSPAAPVYVYYADSSSVTLDPTRIVASVTLPAAVTGGGLVHVFAAAIKTSVTPNNYNNVGISDNSAPTSANFDGLGNSYSAQALAAATPLHLTPGANVNINGVGLTWPNVAPGLPDNYQAAGQVIPITPVANASVLGFLGAATGGAYGPGPVTVTYSDASTYTFPIMFNDWLTGGPSPTDGQLVTTSAYYHSATTPFIVNAPASVYYYEVPLQLGKTVVSVTLPPAPNPSTNPQLHVFAVGTGGTTYNNTGISDDSNPLGANFDAAQDSYSAQALVTAGAAPGQTVTVNSIHFTWPNVASATPDNWQAAGQTIPFATFPGDSTLAFLGSAHFGSSIGTGTINYSDGSKQNFHLAFSDWTLNAGASQPSFGNTIALTMPYRNYKGGQDHALTYVFYMQVTLQSVQTGIGKAKSVVSITLPSTTNHGKLHVFAIASGSPV
ncbi:MAG: hypothetical protein H0W02_03735 [Ktedonobacteraceae bacterium]|nr:hypothetical protein [Ktedonobacteraceae bacterium]